MGLFGFLRKTEPNYVEKAINASSESAALEALGHITDQAELKHVAEGAWRHNQVRKAALERITDQSFLCRCAIEDQVIPVKLCAVDQVSDPWLLLDVWRRELGTPAFREVATHAEERAGQIVEKLDDPEELERFASCDSARCRRAATSRIQEQRLLERIALHEIGDPSDSWQRSLAIEKITSRRVLKQILKKSDPWDADHQAAERRLEELDA